MVMKPYVVKIMILCVHFDFVMSGAREMVMHFYTIFVSTWVTFVAYKVVRASMDVSRDTDMWFFLSELGK